jgi:ATP-dependent RNA helicase RhlE
MSFESLGLRAELLRAVHEHGYDTPTQVQAFAIPRILEGGDLMATAETGSGKTAGFTLPLLQRLMAQLDAGRGAAASAGNAPAENAAAEEAAAEEPATAGGTPAGEPAHTGSDVVAAEADADADPNADSGAHPEADPEAAPQADVAANAAPDALRVPADRNPPRPPRALILVPTRELCAQVTENVRGYGRHLPLRCVQIFGGVGMQPQVVALRSGVDIVIATPGRLLDHIQRGSVDLSGIEVLVLDEADRMLDMGFIDVIRRVLTHLPPTRQNLLFSATLGDDVQALADSLLTAPEHIQVAPRSRPVEAIEQVFYDVEPPHKADALAFLFHERGWPQALIFTRTKHGADRLAKKLYRAGITSDSIHGNKGQGARTRALTRFKNAEIAALVATDVAARGIDIDGLPQVVNFDLPHVPEDYVHRIGRTGRAGQPGHAISLVSEEERRLLQAISRMLGSEFEVQPLEGFVPRVLPPREPRPAQAQSEGEAALDGDGRLDEDGVAIDSRQEEAFAAAEGDDDGQGSLLDRDPRGRRNRRRRRGRGRTAEVTPRTPAALLPVGGILEAFVEGDDERQPAGLGGIDDDAYGEDDDDTQPAWLGQQAAAFDPVDDDDDVEVDDEDNIGNRIIDPPQDFRARSPFGSQDRGRNGRQPQRPGGRDQGPRAPGAARAHAGTPPARVAGPPAGTGASAGTPRAGNEARPRAEGTRGRSRRNRRGGVRPDGQQPNAAGVHKQAGPQQGADAVGNSAAGEQRAPRPPRAEGGASAGGGRRGRQRFRDRSRPQGDGVPSDSIGNSIGNVAAAPGDARARSGGGRAANRNRNGGQQQGGGGNRARRQGGRAVEITHGVSRRRFGFPSDWSKNINTGPRERLDYAPAPLRASSWEGGAPSGDFLRKVDTGQRVAPKIIERKKGRRLLTLKREAETPSEG